MVKTLIKCTIIAALFLIAGCALAESPAEYTLYTLPPPDYTVENEAIDSNGPPEEILQQYSTFAGYAGVALATEELLSSFAYVYEIGTYIPGGKDIVFWDVEGWRMYDLIFFELYDICSDFFITPGAVVRSFISLHPGHAVLIRNFEGSGIFPSHAISFRDTGW